jgi:hypothetical protein
MNRRIPNGTYGGVRGRELITPSYSITIYIASRRNSCSPGGIAEGVRGMQQVWEAAVQNIELSTYAKSRPELREVIRVFGSK